MTFERDFASLLSASSERHNCTGSKKGIHFILHHLLLASPTVDIEDIERVREAAEIKYLQPIFQIIDFMAKIKQWPLGRLFHR